MIDQQLRVERARSSTDPAEQRELLDAVELELRMRLAANPDLHPEVMRELIERDDKMAMLVLAKNPALPARLQMCLTERDPHDNQVSNDILEGLAANTSVVPDVQRVLVTDQYWLVRQGLASNPTVTEECAMVLATDATSYVRIELASNTSITEEVATILAADQLPAIKNRLGENSAVPPRDSLPLGFLLEFHQEYAAKALEGVDPSVMALAREWEGDLTSFLATSQAFGPEC